MREMLEAFRLPGESQQISRIAETFASTYFAAGPGEALHIVCNQPLIKGFSRNQERRCDARPRVLNYHAEY